MTPFWILQSHVQLALSFILWIGSWRMNRSLADKQWEPDHSKPDSDLSFSLSSWVCCILQASEPLRPLALPTYSIVHYFSLLFLLNMGYFFFLGSSSIFILWDTLSSASDSPLASCLEGKKGLHGSEMYSGRRTAVTWLAELGFAGLRNEGKAEMSPNHIREQITESLKHSCVVDNFMFLW